jgi:phosphomannomutase/phosphoglucomutase
MNVNRNIFRKFSIRGIADQDLSDDVAVVLGQAIGTFFKQQNGKSVVVGQDARLSSPRLNQALIKGLLQTGLYVTDVGIVPTPVHHFATDLYRAEGGVMITASHNPPEHNGFKIRANRTLNEEQLQTIHRIIQDRRFVRGSGQLMQTDPLPTYWRRIKTHARIQRPLKIVVDGGNGTNGLIVAKLLRDLGCQVVELYCEPDGSFPNRVPDPTAPGATQALSRRVRDEGADLGLAYDGDGDRLALVDEKGNGIWGDQLLMILARDLLRQGPAKIVHDITCTQALADDVTAHGGEPIITPSGYAFVHQAMSDTDAALGGEFSGHIFFNEPDFRFDDAILATVKLLNILSQSQRSLSALVAELPSYQSLPPIRLDCPDEIKHQVVEGIKNHFKASYPVNELDGARIDFGDAWALVRPSNTQPALALRFEAQTIERAQELQSQVLAQIDRWMTKLGHPTGQGIAPLSERL